MEDSLQTLIGRLNPTCRKGLEGAAGLCVAQTNYNVEVEHLILKLLEIDNCDIDLILKHFDLNSDQVRRQLTRVMDGFKRGNARTPAMSPHILTLLREAWVQSTLVLHEDVIRSASIMIALFTKDAMRGLMLDSMPLMLKIPRGVMIERIYDITDGSIEQGARPAKPVSAKPKGSLSAAQGSPDLSLPAGSGKTPNLDQFTIDLTGRAAADELDPIRGRDFEIRQIIDILMRRRQNNPLLTGEAGVGKTAVAEGFAQRIADGDVPPPLQGIEVRTLDIGLLQAGAGVKGEFENRLKSVIAEVKGSPIPILVGIPGSA